MKVKLLNNGGYTGADNVDFDTIFSAEITNGNNYHGAIEIKALDLVNAGADSFMANDGDTWPFLIGEYEVIEP